MHADIVLTHDPIAAAVVPELPIRAGAWVEYRGLARAAATFEPMAALEYEAYEQMAVQTMCRIINDLGQIHPCLFVRAIHRIGVVPIGHTAISVLAIAIHRREACSMICGFMDRFKQDVPIWKVRALPALAAA